MPAWLRYMAAHSEIVAATVFAFYALSLVCAIREVMNSRTSQGSIAWLVSLALLPFPTTFIYLVLGWKHFDGYAKGQTRGSRITRPSRARGMPLTDEAAGRAWPVLTGVSQLPFLSGNEVRLLIDGQA